MERRTRLSDILADMARRVNVCPRGHRYTPNPTYNGGCDTCAKQRAHAWIRANPDRRREQSRLAAVRARARDKAAAMAAYGGRCDCCGEARMSFLTIDHPLGDGAAHRRAIYGVRPDGPVRETRTGGGGHRMYRWLRISGYPAGFRVLCFNCNIGSHINGGVCPHREQVMQ